MCSVASNAAEHPAALERTRPAWRDADVPGTVASALRARGELDLDHPEDFDATDWWYRAKFTADPAGARAVLCFDGLATLADVWLNNEHVLASDDMFLSHEVDVTQRLAAENVIHIRFRSLRAALAERRPRPRWRTKLVEHQQLRWFRTTLLGRIPGWSPAVRAVGPWRSIRLEPRTVLEIVERDVDAIAGSLGGRVDVALKVRVLGAPIRDAMLYVGDHGARLSVTGAGESAVIQGSLDVPAAEHWWPHTHGTQPRYAARVVVTTSEGSVEIDLGLLAFRRISLDATDGRFALSVNDVPIFCRGACWTTPDIVSLAGSPEHYRGLLTLARDGGMNMLRIGGTMAYEDDAFYDLCDELGILVWQDFAFANMDYPAGDVAFAALVEREARQLLGRLRRHPSLAMLCGNSEVEQQAAMLGFDRASWTGSLFHDVLPRLCRTMAPGIPYTPTTPSGSPLPFHTDTGLSHYYGVGAYLRPVEDARRSNVRFTSECLGFANVPDQRAIDALLPNGESPHHHARWKARVPRDHGAGWDFEDIRDHYLASVFGVDPMLLRYADMERYLALSRIVTGEVMAQIIGEWRRAGSSCRGALIWFFQDLWPGAGWGLVDSFGRPKPAYYAVKRAMQPVALAMTNEGVNGIHIHIANDALGDLEGALTVMAIRGTTTVASANAPVRVPGRSALTVSADAMMGRFHDLSYAYRFGPPGHDVVTATVVDRDGATRAQAFLFPRTIPVERSHDQNLAGWAEPVDAETVAITLQAKAFVQFVAIDAGDFVPEDNYFNMIPGAARIVVARAAHSGARFGGVAQSLNSHEALRIELIRKERPAVVGSMRDLVVKP